MCCGLKEGMLMKLARKLFIMILIIIGFISSTVLADSIVKEIKVYFRDIIIEIDDKEVLIDTQPFIYNNKVYVAVRELVEELNGEVEWHAEYSKVKIKSYKDFPECDYYDGEIFVYGIVTALDKEEKIITIEQHLDDNSMDVKPDLEIRDDVVIILQRNDKKMNLDISDLKAGEDLGLILDKNGLVRGIIISK